jgi:hypothetical protein
MFPTGTGPYTTLETKALEKKNRPDTALMVFIVFTATYLYSGDDRLRPDSSVLLCLLLYSDFILSVPEPANASSPWHRFSLPDLVVRHMRLPFVCHSHWHNSPHTQLSEKRTELICIMGGLCENSHVICLYIQQCCRMHG